MFFNKIPGEVLFLSQHHHYNPWLLPKPWLAIYSWRQPFIRFSSAMSQDMPLSKCIKFHLHL